MSCPDCAKLAERVTVLEGLLARSERDHALQCGEILSADAVDIVIEWPPDADLSPGYKAAMNARIEGDDVGY